MRAESKWTKHDKQAHCACWVLLGVFEMSTTRSGLGPGLVRAWSGLGSSRARTERSYFDIVRYGILYIMLLLCIYQVASRSPANNKRKTSQMLKRRKCSINVNYLLILRASFFI